MTTDGNHQLRQEESHSHTKPSGLSLRCGSFYFVWKCIFNLTLQIYILTGMVPQKQGGSSVEEDEFAQVVGENSKALSSHTTTEYIQIPKTRSSVRLRGIDLIRSS